jgi:nitrous oxide reductase accessory protein NosL
MKIAHSKTLALLAVTTALLTTACGGGNDDDAGSPAPFQVQPSSVGLKDGTANCTAGGPVGTVFIFGGAAPYRIRNSSPAWITVDKTSFTITATGYGCLSPGQVFVTDNLNNLVTVTVTLEKT